MDSESPGREGIGWFAFVFWGEKLLESTGDTGLPSRHGMLLFGLMMRLADKMGSGYHAVSDMTGQSKTRKTTLQSHRQRIKAEINKIIGL